MVHNMGNDYAASLIHRTHCVPRFEASPGGTSVFGVLEQYRPIGQIDLTHMLEIPWALGAHDVRTSNPISGKIGYGSAGCSVWYVWYE